MGWPSYFTSKFKLFIRTSLSQHKINALQHVEGVCKAKGTEAPLSVADPLGACILSEAQDPGDNACKKRVLTSALQLFSRSRSSVRSKLLQPSGSNHEPEVECHERGLTQQRSMSSESKPSQGRNPSITIGMPAEHGIVKPSGCHRGPAKDVEHPIILVDEKSSDPLDRLNLARSRVIDLVSQHLGLDIPKEPAATAVPSVLKVISKIREQNTTQPVSSLPYHPPAAGFELGKKRGISIGSDSQECLAHSNEFDFWDQVGGLNSQQPLPLSSAICQASGQPSLHAAHKRARSGSVEGQHKQSLSTQDLNATGSLQKSENILDSPAFALEDLQMTSWTDVNHISPGIDLHGDPSIDSIRHECLNEFGRSEVMPGHDDPWGRSSRSILDMLDTRDLDSDQVEVVAPMSLMQELDQDMPEFSLSEDRSLSQNLKIDNFMQALEDAWQ